MKKIDLEVIEQIELTNGLLRIEHSHFNYGVCLYPYNDFVPPKVHFPLTKDQALSLFASYIQIDMMK